MLFQRTNGKKNKRFVDQHRMQHRIMGNMPITDAQTGFIHHRQGFPLRYKRSWNEGGDNHVDSKQSTTGLLFQSDEYLRPGTMIEATISLDDRTETIRGKVVMVRDRGDYYEIGLWLKHHEDASRARIVEQACYIEAYIKEKKFRDGPYILNRDGAAEEWISRNAAGVPGL